MKGESSTGCSAREETRGIELLFTGRSRKCEGMGTRRLASATVKNLKRGNKGGELGRTAIMKIFIMTETQRRGE